MSAPTLAVVESRADRASVHVCERLRALADWERREDDSRPDAAGGGTWFQQGAIELRSFEDWHLQLDRPVDAFACDPDLLVFASRHSGETGPLLTGHFTGNVGPAEFGGADHAVAEAAPNALTHLLDSFEAHAPDGYDVGMECTHHGPTDVGCPSLFAELGSDEAQWDDPDAADAVARAILDLRGVQPHREERDIDAPGNQPNADSVRRRQIVGFGGGHYAPRFGRIVRETPWAVGHVAADWALDALADADPGPDTRRAVLQALFRASGAQLAVIDGDRPDLETELAALGYRVVSETWLRSVDDRSLDLVDAVESALGEIETGVRFGERRTTDFVVTAFPTDLVETAEGIDATATRAAVDRHAVAVDTVEGGNRLGERVALPRTLLARRPDAARLPDPLVADLAAVLTERFDAVDIRAEAVVAEETAFDPALAREAGVPAGPAFGALAAGESVTVDDRRVDPADVHVERTHRFDR